MMSFSKGLDVVWVLGLKKLWKDWLLLQMSQEDWNFRLLLQCAVKTTLGPCEREEPLWKITFCSTIYSWWHRSLVRSWNVVFKGWITFLWMYDIFPDASWSLITVLSDVPLTFHVAIWALIITYNQMLWIFHDPALPHKDLFLKSQSMIEGVTFHFSFLSHRWVHCDGRKWSTKGSVLYILKLKH